MIDEGGDIEKELHNNSKMSFDLTFLGLPSELPVAVTICGIRTTFTTTIKCDGEFDVEKLQFMPVSKLAFAWSHQSPWSQQTLWSQHPYTSSLCEFPMSGVIYDNIYYDFDYYEIEKEYGVDNIILASDFTAFKPEYMLEKFYDTPDE